MLAMSRCVFDQLASRDEVITNRTVSMDTLRKVFSSNHHCGQTGVVWSLA